MLIPFGKTLRKIHIDQTERLLDMADKLGVSIAFLSSVEIGKMQGTHGESRMAFSCDF